jgi:hypothetical protein
VDQQVNEAEHTHRRGPEQQPDSERVTLSNRLLGATRDNRRGSGGSHAAGAGRCRGLELDQQLTRGLPPIGGTLLEAAHQTVLSGADTAARCLVTGSGAWVMWAASRACGVVRRTGSAGEHLVRQAPRVDVRAMIHVGIGRRLLRRHVGRSSQGHAE